MSNPDQLTEAEARKTGSKQGVIAVITGLLLAELMITSIVAFDEGIIRASLWFTTLGINLNIFIGVAIMLLCGYFFGSIAGKQIILRNSNFVLTGFLWGMAVLLTTAFLSGWTGFFQEGLTSIGTNDNPFEDYIFKPFYWIAFSGAIPASVVGIWLGWRIKRSGRKHNIVQGIGG